MIVTADCSYLESLLKGKQLQLLFRATRDGWRYYEFHDRCDNKGPTLTLIKTVEGRVCGGYTSVSWDTRRSYKTDSESYLFTLNPNHTFVVKQPDGAIECNRKWGPMFGNSLEVWLGWDGDCWSDAIDDIFGNIQDKDGNSLLTGSEDEFIASEVEVFRVV